MNNKIDFYFDEAKDFVQKISDSLDINSVILDEWGKAYRLIYDLNNSDEEVEKILGVDFLNYRPAKSTLPFVTTLCYPTYKQILTFQSESRFLNIKKVDQYLNCYIRWFNTWCFTEKEINNEFCLVKGFKIIYMRGVNEQEYVNKEKEYKKNIIDKSIEEMSNQINFLKNVKVD